MCNMTCCRIFKPLLNAGLIFFERTPSKRLLRSVASCSELLKVQHKETLGKLASSISLERRLHTSPCKFGLNGESFDCTVPAISSQPHTHPHTQGVTHTHTLMRTPTHTHCGWVCAWVCGCASHPHTHTVGGCDAHSHGHLNYNVCTFIDSN